MTDAREIGTAVRTLLSGAVDGSLDDAGFDRSVWDRLEDSGFAGVGVPESAGGSGGGPDDLVEVLFEVGRAGLSLPIVQHTVLAGWALAAACAQLPTGVLTFARASDGLMAAQGPSGLVVEGRLARVPWADDATHLVVIADLLGERRLIVLERDQYTVEPGHDLAGQSRDEVLIDGAIVVAADCLPAPASLTDDAIERRAAWATAAMIAGALDRISALTTRYVTEREQFGRPLMKFQAVQRHVVLVAELAAQVAAAVRGAAGDDGAPFAMAASKIVANELGSQAAASAHQAHGAIGMTREYELGRLTRRIWAWRDEHGTTRHWSRWLGASALAAGDAGAWSLLTNQH